MNQLTDDQKKELVKRMHANDNLTWNTHAHWATGKFGVQVTPDLCRQLFFASMFEKA